MYDMYDMYKLSEKYELSDNWISILLRRVSPDSPRPFPLQKRNRKSGWKSEAGTGEENDEFYMPLNFRSPYIVALTGGKSAIR